MAAAAIAAAPAPALAAAAKVESSSISLVYSIEFIQCIDLHKIGGTSGNIMFSQGDRFMLRPEKQQWAESTPQPFADNRI